MGYYKIKINMTIPKSIVKDVIDEQKGNVKMAMTGFISEYFVEEKNSLLCYERAIKELNKKMKEMIVTVNDEKGFQDKIANIKCLKYMQNAKKGNKFKAIPLYYLTNENRELHFEITKTTKEKYDKYIEKVKKENDRRKK